MKIGKTQWSLLFSEKAASEFQSLDKGVREQMTKRLQKIVGNPMAYLKPLTGNLKHLYSMRLGTYRILCQVKHEELIILAIAIGHRKNIYHS